MKRIMLALFTFILATGFVFAVEQPKKGAWELGFMGGIRTVTTDHAIDIPIIEPCGHLESFNTAPCIGSLSIEAPDTLDTRIGAMYRGWFRDNWSLGAQIDTTTGWDHTGGRLDAAYHRGAFYVPIIMSYIDEPFNNSVAWGAGIGVGLMGDEHIRIEIEFDVLYPQSSDFRQHLDTDWIYDTRVVVGFPW